MRQISVVRSLAVVALAAACLLPGSAIAAKRTPKCAVARGDLLARSGTWVISRRNASPLLWFVCDRRTGRRRLLARAAPAPSATDPNGPPNALTALRLAGNYAAYDANWSDRYDHYYDRIVVVDLRTNRPRSSLDSANLPCPGQPNPLLLSATGIAAWRISYGCVRYGGYGLPGSSVEAFSYSSADSQTLDAAGPGTLANLQLYQCEAGCRNSTTAVAWTDAGTRRWALVQ